MGRRKQRKGEPDANGFRRIGGQGGGDFVEGCPHDAVPSWSCGCGIHDNFGNRRRCRGCGRLAPSRIERQQHAAVQAAKGASATAKAQKSSQSSQHQESDASALRRKVQQLEAENQRLKTSATSVAAAAPPKQAPAPKSETEMAADENVTVLERSLANLRRCDHPGVENHIADVERQLSQARSDAH